MNKAEIIVELEKQGFKVEALEPLTVPMLTAMHAGVDAPAKIAELTEVNAGLKEANEKMLSENTTLNEEVDSLKEENTTLNEEVDSLKEESSDLTEVNAGLLEKLSQQEFESKSGINTLKIGKKVYAITVKKFSFKGVKYTADDLKANDDLQKEIIKGGYGMLEEIEVAD